MGAIGAHHARTAHERTVTENYVLRRNTKNSNSVVIYTVFGIKLGTSDGLIRLYLFQGDPAHVCPRTRPNFNATSSPPGEESSTVSVEPC